MADVSYLGHKSPPAKAAAMTDYSKMSYQQLRSIADNDAIAQQMSEEEYEALSIQMWRKFGIEQGIREHQKSPEPGQRQIPVLRGLLNLLRSKPTADKQPTPPSNPSPASPRELGGLFRSGD
jgi:hypothetical protein